MRTRQLLIAAAVLTTALPAQAQDGPMTATFDKNPPENEGIFGFDYGPPGSAALNLAGLSPEKTTVASSFKPFIISLPGLASGADGEAAALDLAPAFLFGQGERQTLDQYRTNDALRFYDRLRFSAAATNGVFAAGDPKKQKPSKMAIGLTASLLDRSDPLMLRVPSVAGQPGPYAYEACIDKIVHRPVRTAALFALNSPLLEYQRLRGRLEAGQPPLTAAELSTLEALVPAAAAEPKPPPEIDRRAVAATEYLRELARTQNWDAALQADLLRVTKRVVDAGMPAPGPAPGSAEAQQRYRDGLDKLITAAEAANDKTAVAVSTDLGIMEAATGCAQHVSKLAMYRTQLNVGGGLLWRGEPGKLQDMDRTGGTVWLGFRQPLAVLFGEKAGADGKGPLRYVMLGASVRRAWDEVLATGDATVPEVRADTWDYWAGVEWLHPRNQLAFQYGWLDAKVRDPAQAAFSRSGNRWLISEKFLLTSAQSGVWIGLSYGEVQGNSIKLKDETFLFTVTVGPPKAPNLFKQEK